MTHGHKIINPAGLAKPRGFNHGVLATGGHILFMAGQDASDANGQIVGVGDVVKQYDQVLHNLQAVVEEAKGHMHDIAKLNIYVTDRALYKAHQSALGAVHQTYFGDYYPAIALFEVKSLFQDDALIELEGVAVIHSEEYYP